MEYVDQSADNIVLNTIDGDFSFDELNLISQKEFFIGRTKISFGILGASHFLKVENKNDIFAEVFACIKMDKKESFSLIDAASNKSLNLEKKLLDYSFKSTRVKMDSNSKKRYSSVVAQSSLVEVFPGDAEYIFPMGEDSFEFEPLTAIAIKAVGKDIYLETLHSYPNEQTLIFTDTKITLK